MKHKMCLFGRNISQIYVIKTLSKLGFPKPLIILDPLKSYIRDKKTLSLGKKLEQSFPNRFRFYQIKFSQLDSISDDHVAVSFVFQRSCRYR